jgi:hypothetical protein
LSRARGPEHLGTGIRGRAGREYVIHENDPLAVQSRASAQSKGAADIRGALLSGQKRLGSCWYDTPEQGFVQRHFRRDAQMPREAFSLIEFPLALLRGMQRHRHDQIPFLLLQRGHRLPQENIGEK